MFASVCPRNLAGTLLYACNGLLCVHVIYVATVRASAGPSEDPGNASEQIIDRRVIVVMGLVSHARLRACWLRMHQIRSFESTDQHHRTPHIPLM